MKRFLLLILGIVLTISSFTGCTWLQQIYDEYQEIVYKYNGELTGTLNTSNEIENFMWFGIDDDTSILSNTLKNEVVPYCVENGLIFKNKTK